MIVPSIDLMNGHAVQLVGGKEMKLDAGDPYPICERFRVVGEIAVVDLDAALGKGDNTAVMEKLCRMAPCRVGGGIRDAESALRWLDAGATKVVLGTAAVPEVLKKLPPDRVVAALDAYNDEVVVKGWTEGTGARVIDRMKELRGLAGHFLVTFVEREGRLTGLDLDRVAALVEACGDAKLTIAGGVKTAQDIADADRLGANAQVGMALYTNRIGLGECVSTVMNSDRPDGLWPTVVCDERGTALGLVYSDDESLRDAIDNRRGTYHSRSRGLWVKGATSGNTQELLRVDVDCDRDALRFIVRQQGAGFCHTGTWSCFGEDDGLGRLARRLAERVIEAPEGSYTRRLLNDPALLRAKLVEEAGELGDAETGDEVIWEAADVLYFTLVRMAGAGITLSDVEAELDRRELKVSRRPGNAKEGA